MLDFIGVIAIVALGASWIIDVAYKMGVIEYWQAHTRFDLVNEMLNCKFCLSWWTCLVLSAVMAAVYGEWICLFAAVLATNITKRII